MNMIARFFITLYQYVISPFNSGCCRFYPTCSEYSKQAFQYYPVHKALYLSLKRLLKCNPFGPHGADPLPLDENTIKRELQTTD